MGQVNVADALTGTITYSQALGSHEVSKLGNASFITVISAIDGTAGTFTAAATDICTKANHGFATGLKVQVSTDNALPAGLLAVTDYFVIAINANTFKLASSLVNAQAGTAVDITDTGTGTHTITPTALAGASVKLQGSMNGTDWADLAIKATGDATKSASISAISNKYLNAEGACVNYIRQYYTLTAGQLVVSEIAQVQF